jgi:hypothetical protein
MKIKDLKPGQRIGRWTLIQLGKTDAGRKMWLCSCLCGAIRVVQATHLARGASNSCGCGAVKHGHSRTGKRTLTLNSWRNMKSRCLNPNSTQWKYYGAKGVGICQRWLKFENFLADMGIRPSRLHTLDRKDPDGNYTPSNTRWALPKVQQNNKRKKKPNQSVTQTKTLAASA